MRWKSIKTGLIHLVEDCFKVKSVSFIHSNTIVPKSGCAVAIVAKLGLEVPKKSTCWLFACSFPFSPVYLHVRVSSERGRKCERKDDAPRYTRRERQTVNVEADKTMWKNKRIQIGKQNWLSCLLQYQHYESGWNQKHMISLYIVYVN